MGIVDQVHFTGMVPYHEIPSYLVAADAFVTASVTEVHPLSVIEAMAAGLPVLGIHSPGVSDTVESGETGFLVPEEDLAAFTARMVRLVTDAEERRAMGEKARQAVKKYSIERTSQIMLEHYTTVTRQAQGNKNSLRARWQRLRDEWSQ
jgi:glycosyltransferase involved in cell wall biosynthesis